MRHDKIRSAHGKMEQLINLGGGWMKRVTGTGWMTW